MVVITDNLSRITAGSRMAISEVFRRNGMIQRSLIRPGLIGLRTKIIGVPTIGLPAVTLLRHIYVAHMYCIPT